MNEKDTAAYISLNMAFIGFKTLEKLLEVFKTPENILKQKANHLKTVEGVGEEKAERITSLANGIQAKAEIEKAKKLGVEILTLEKENYPSILKQIYDPPIILYARGNFRESDKNSIAIIGSRRTSVQGRLNAQKFAYEIAASGWTIVSGLARGIDTAAHMGALRSHGRTIAVLGSGIDVMYPAENKELADNISKNGVLLSEFPFGTQPLRENFPRRNRIVSGLSKAIVVVEASEKSGALITAGFALEQGREVFVIPGDVSIPTTRGSHLLLKDGANLALTPDDILAETEKEEIREPKISEVLQPKDKKEKKIKSELNKEQNELLKIMNNEPMHIDEIKELSNLGLQELNKLLLKLEICGSIKQFPGKKFSKQ